jgi:hypothetical protein
MLSTEQTYGAVALAVIVVIILIMVFKAYYPQATHGTSHAVAGPATRSPKSISKSSYPESLK